MKKKKYNEIITLNNAYRRDYSKVSGSLELPNLIEVQTDSFKWFIEEGIKEVFEEIFPIKSNKEDYELKFIDFEFANPQYSVNQCLVRERSYSARLHLNMVLHIISRDTGEIIEKAERVFLGDMPIMTPNGSFVINGAERVVVSQILRSPGAYFSVKNDKTTNKDSIESQIIPSRGTWLELTTKESSKKNDNVPVIYTAIDRKPDIFASILLKAIGFSFDHENTDDPKDTSRMKRFLNFIGKEYNEDYDTNEDSYISIYKLLTAAYFGNYDELLNSFSYDKIDSTRKAVLAIQSNQKKDDVITIDGAYNLINAKFFDYKKYDLAKAGRFKLNRKLSIIDRLENNILREDLYDFNNKILIKKDTLISKKEREILKEQLSKGANIEAFPMNNIFSDPSKVIVDTKDQMALVNRVLACDIELDDVDYLKGQVINKEDVAKIAKNLKQVSVYGGIVAKEIVLTTENINLVLDYGQRLFSLSRIVDVESNDDILDENEELLIPTYAKKDHFLLSNDHEKLLHKLVKEGRKIKVYLVGSAQQVVRMSANKSDHIISIIGNDPLLNKTAITISDIYAYFNYHCSLSDNVGNSDDIDELSNRRVRTVGELLQNQFRIGLTRLEKGIKDKMSTIEADKASPKTLINVKPLTSAISEFFNSSQLSQFMDQQNPLAELTNKRRISALGPGGLTRERAGFEVRDIHNSHYGRICPIETPEGQNIGLITNLTTYGKINRYGFIETPYRKVDKDFKVSDEVIYLSADEEADYIIAQANEVINGKIVNDIVVARKAGETVSVSKEEVDLVDVSPKQIVSVAAACIPFLENDDASRTLMGANMQRQAVPLLRPNSPYVGTGIEAKIASDSGAGIIANEDGIATYVDGRKIIVSDKEGKEHVYELEKFRRSNAGTCINQRPIVKSGQSITKGMMLADGPSMQQGELALGQNVTIAFMTWHGYNYEDAIIISERMVKDDVYTSIHIDEYSVEFRDTKQGPEEMLRDVPNASDSIKRHLDSRGIAAIGSEVKEGDILVGRVTPKGVVENNQIDRLMAAIFQTKGSDVKDNSLRVPHGGSGIVQDVRIFRSNEGYDLPPGVNTVVKVFIAQKRKISEGDKMAGRHGNKGVISKILPVEDMPFMEDGTPIDIMLNPFGVPSRMNIGQVLEIHLGMAAKKLGIKFATPVFDGVNNEELKEIMEEAKVSPDGKVKLIDGRTGETYDERISVGVMYMIKLAHMVDDKLHARSTGPYSLVTQQPLGGKAQNGGQRFGEMEVWALEAYGASNILEEMLTIKSDDRDGRNNTLKAIKTGDDIPVPGLPASFKVLRKEVQALAIDLKMIDEDENEIEIDKFAKKQNTSNSYVNNEEDDDSYDITDYYDTLLVDSKEGE